MYTTLGLDSVPLPCPHLGVAGTPLFPAQEDSPT